MTSMSTRTAAGVFDRVLLAEKIATSLRKTQSLAATSEAFGLSTRAIRDMANDFDFPIPEVYGGTLDKDDPGECSINEMPNRIRLAAWDRARKGARDRLRALQTPPSVPIPLMTATETDVLADVCARHRCALSVLISKDRQPDLVWARHEAAWLLVTRLGLTYKKTGQVLGGRHWSTVMGSVAKFRESGK